MNDWRPFSSSGELVDVLVVAALCWLALRVLRRTRAQRALLGLATLGLVYAGARWLELELTATLFRGFFAVLVLILVVVFQDDLRRIFEELGTWGRGTRLQSTTQSADLIARAAARLAALRCGALLVVPGRESLETHVEGGVELHGRLSEPLLLSLFDTSSPGHDGAVCIGDGSVERFAVHLPLSSDRAQLGPGGTRHAAALGLSERCDALCIVVSEERGTISVARNGVLRSDLRPEELAEEIRSLRPSEATSIRWWKQRTLWLEAGGSLGVALLLWGALVLGADLAESELQAAVLIDQLPPEYRLSSATPSQVRVRLSGQRRDLVLVQPGSVSVRVDADLVRLGRRTFALSAQDVRRPEGIQVVAIEPDRIKLTVVASTESPESGAQPR